MWTFFSNKFQTRDVTTHSGCDLGPQEIKTPANRIQQASFCSENRAKDIKVGQSEPEETRSDLFLHGHTDGYCQEAVWGEKAL